MATVAAAGGFEALTTLTIKTAASTATLTLTRKKDGSFEFTDKAGKKVRLHSHRDDAMKSLFEALAALV